MSIITRLKEKYFSNYEFHFKGYYKYCGQGTNLKNMIRNTNFILSALDDGIDFLKLDILYNSLKFIPHNGLDRFCQEHDFYYLLSEEKPDRLEREKEADLLLIDRIIQRMTILSPVDPEYNDCKIVKEIIKMKIEIDENKCFCNLS